MSYAVVTKVSQVACPPRCPPRTAP